MQTCGGRDSDVKPERSHLTPLTKTDQVHLPLVPEAVDETRRIVRIGAAFLHEA